MKFAGWYGLIVGVLMFLQWAFFLASGSVPEVQSAPLEIAFHLAAEFITAAGLVWSGAALLRGRKASAAPYLIFLGMVIYSEIVSPGYFAQQGQWPLVVMFAVLLALAVTIAFQLIRNPGPAGR